MSLLKLIPDFSSGPLDEARNKASFCWKQLKCFIETEHSYNTKMKVWKAIENDPIFCQDKHLCIDEKRRIAEQRARRLSRYGFQPPLHDDKNTWRPTIEAIALFDCELALKFFIRNFFFVNSLKYQGTEFHDKFIQEALKEEIIGCVCLTEIGHGSNSKQLKTIATYDPKTEEFIINSPNFEAAKCWAGLSGKTATHATVFAQLYTPDNKNHGIHGFVIQLRDTNTLHPLPGIIIGDMGSKIGLNGLDNGYILFNNVRIARNNLLNNIGDVSKDGRYYSAYQDANKRFGATMSPFNLGRVSTLTLAYVLLTKATVIAVRYSAVRKQFSATRAGDEMPVLSYQLQQWRLLPYVTCCYLYEALISSTFKYIGDQREINSADTSDHLNDLRIELHAIVSACKVFTTAISQEGIQKCREACGGHGYLRAASLGKLRNDNDALVTFEGANDVLLQQASNWLLSLWSRKKNNSVQFSSPLKSVSFLNNITNVINAKFNANSNEDLLNPNTYIEMYQWLICYYIKITEERMQKCLGKGQNMFEVRNNSQVYHAHDLGIAYAEHFLVINFLDKIKDADVSLKPVLYKLNSLFALWRLEKHLTSFYSGGYTEGPKMTKLLHDTVLELLQDLEKDSVALVDTLSPPDFILNSVLGISNGEVYKALESSFYKNPDTFALPSWWKELKPNCKL